MACSLNTGAGDPSDRPPQSVAEQLAERAATGAELQLVPMPTGTAAEAGKRLEALLG